MYNQHPPPRRRKKRHAQPTRTVEINRGRNGYGFTISGQHPCILSCIVGGSPADKMGLKMGDLLMSVNNRDVSQASHDDVVRLIGSSRGLLILQIAGRPVHSSDSSDDDVQMRGKSKYPNKTRMRHAPSKQSVDDTVLYTREKSRQHSRKDLVEQARLRALSPGRELERRHQEKYERYHHDMRGMGIENIDPSLEGLHTKRMSSNDGIIQYRSSNTKHTIITREARLGQSKSQSEMMRPPPGGAADRGGPSYHRNVSRRPPPEPNVAKEENDELLGDYLRVIVGYVGTVGMARDSKNDTARMQSIRNAVHRLKVERKMTTMVLMELTPIGVRLINTMGSTVASYAAEHIAFSGVHSEDKRFLGIVTIHIETIEDARMDTDVSDSSCHVFKVNPELCAHSLHIHKVRNFGVHCTIHPDTQQCREFPRSAIPIMRCMSHLYRERPSALYETEMAQIGAFARPEFPGQSMESNSSNGDSGLGVNRDEQLQQESGNSNRVCVVEMHDNSRNSSEGSFRWETDQSGLVTPHTSSLYNYGEPEVSPILPDSIQIHAGAMEHSGLSGHGSLSESILPGTSTMERLNVRARPDPRGESSARHGARVVLGHTNSTEIDMADDQSIKSNDSQGAANTNRQRQVSSSSNEGQSRQKGLSVTISSTNVSSTRNESLDTTGRSAANVSSALSASVTDTSCSSNYDTTPNPTPTNVSNSSSTWARPLPKPPSYPTRPVPQPPSDNSTLDDIDKPPVPERQPIIPRKAPKTPANPPLTSRPKPPRPKSTPPFQELHKPTGEDGDQSGYDSEPGSTMDTEECPPLPPPNVEKPPARRTRQPIGRLSEAFALSKKEKGDGLMKKPGSFRQVTDKPFRRQTLTGSHESLVVSKEDGTSNHGNTTRLNAATSVTTITSKGVVVTSQPNGVVETVGRAASWAVSFDKLLRDNVGLKIFTDFLKKEFSEENIVFWKACEDYKKNTNAEERKRLCQDIFNKHMSSLAPDPVNIDSAARQVSKDLLLQAPTDTFETAQLQIFRLMKQDSYVRFLKSDGYKSCVMAEMEGKPLPGTDVVDDSNNNQAPTVTAAPSTPGERWRKTLKKSKSSTNAATSEDGVGEEKRRRSLLPWTKSKIEKRIGKATTDTDLRNKAGLDLPTHGKGRPSLDLADLNTISKQIQGSLQEVDPKNVSAKESHKFCRVILPDSSTTVIVAATGRTIRQAMCELCERRQIILSLVNISLAGETQPLDMSRDLSVLASRQIIMDRMCIFRLDLPQRRSVCVRAKPSQTIATVFRPILAKYNLVLDQNVVVHVVGTGVILREDQEISSLEHKQVMVQSLDDFKEWGSYGSHRGVSTKPPIPRLRSDPYKQAKSLVEVVTNLFREMLDGMSTTLDANNICFDETSSWDVTKYKIEENRGSGILGFIRRNSIGEKEGNKTKAKPTKIFTSVRQNKPAPGGSTQAPLPPPSVGRGRGTTLPPPPPPGGRGRGKRFDADDERLFELLSRAQSRQMDDQRGLSAGDFVLPDFLKVEDMEQPHSARGVEGARSPNRSGEPRPMSAPASRLLEEGGRKSEFSSMDFDQQIGEGLMTPRTAKFAAGHDSFSSDGVLPTPNRATNFFKENDDMETSQIMEGSLCDLGMTSDLQGQGRSYTQFMARNTNNVGDRLSPRATGNQVLNAPQPRPRVPRRQNPPGHTESSDSDRSKRRTPNMSSDDDLDITLIPPSDSSGEEVGRLPSPPKVNTPCLNHTNRAEFSPPTPLSRQNGVGANITHRSPENLPPPRSLTKQSTYSKMVASHMNQSSISSSSGRDSDMDVDFTGQMSSGRDSQSTPSPTTHDLVLDMDSGSEYNVAVTRTHHLQNGHAGHMIAPQPAQRRNPPLGAAQSAPNKLPRAKKSLFEPKENPEKVQVSFV